MPLIFWVSLTALITIHLPRGHAIWCTILVAFSAATFPSHIFLGRYMAIRERDQAAAAMSMTVGVPDLARIGEELGSMTMIAIVEQDARVALGRSLFARPEAQWLETPLRDHFAIAPEGACTGAVDMVVPLPRGARLGGWALDTRRGQATARIWITDSQSIIRGLGITGRPRISDTAGWIAYSRPIPNGDAFTVFAEIRDSRTVCRIPSGQ
jgi:hypothetical protein